MNGFSCQGNQCFQSCINHHLVKYQLQHVSTSTRQQRDYALYITNYNRTLHLNERLKRHEGEFYIWGHCKRNS